MKLPQFDGHWDHWSEVMENFFRAKGLWRVIETGYEEPTITTVLTAEQREQLDNAKTNDHKVKHYLYQSIDRVTLEQILDRKTSKVIWDSMKRKFGGNDRVKRSLLQKLRRDFELLEMKETEKVEEYFTRVLAITNQMRSNGEEMPDQKVVEKILRTLSEKFMYVVVSIKESKEIENITVEELQSSLVVHEQKFRKPEKEEDKLLIVTQGRGSGSRGRGFNGRGRGRGRGRGFTNKSTVECYKCHRLGHFQYECPKWEEEANYAEETEDMLLMAYVEEEETDEEIITDLVLMTHSEARETARRTSWFLDSGCSNHMSGDRELFSTMDGKFKHSAKLGNNKKMEVVGKGNVKIVLRNTAYTISDVLYEKKGWNWEEEQDYQIESDLTWNDDNVSWEDSEEEASDDEVPVAANNDEAPVAAPEQANEPEQPVEVAEEVHNEQAVQTREGRRVRRPRYLNDYVTGSVMIDDEDEVHMVNMVEHNATDPSTFEEAKENCNSVSNPMVPGSKMDMDEGGERVDETFYKQIIGSLMYITNTRPGLQFSVSLLSRFMSKPTQLHVQVAKRVLRYLRGTVDFGIWYKGGGNSELQVYTDSDFVGDVESRKSTSGYVFLMDNAAVAWLSKKQPIVTLSTTEAEYVSASVCACQAVWFKRILEELGHHILGGTTIWCDNTSTIKLSKNQVFHGRCKHIGVRFHFLRELVNNEEISLEHYGSQEQIADILTKPLRREVFENLRSKLGICSVADKLSLVGQA
ncbi:hypothetical protein YC2023_022094 [Brassica napus]